MVEYGLLASKTASFFGDFSRQMQLFLGSMPLWQTIGICVVVPGILHYFFKIR